MNRRTFLRFLGSAGVVYGAAPATLVGITLPPVAPALLVADPVREQALHDLRIWLATQIDDEFMRAFER